jgi:hypothetical protein
MSDGEVALYVVGIVATLVICVAMIVGRFLL